MDQPQSENRWRNPVPWIILGAVTLIVVLCIIFLTGPREPEQLQVSDLVHEGKSYDRQTVVVEGCVMIERTYPMPSPGSSTSRRPLPPHITEYRLRDTDRGAGSSVELDDSRRGTHLPLESNECRAFKGWWEHRTRTLHLVDA